jgi:bacterioferritin-associated ferredoxin
MIVCICRGASDRDVNRAIEAGASSIADLQHCGIGTECGSCHNFLRRMLAVSLSSQIADRGSQEVPPQVPANCDLPTAI